MNYSYVNDYTQTTQSYIKELSDSKYEPIPREIEDDLIENVKKGDEYSLKQLVDAHLRLVINIAKKYRGRGVELEELIAEGNVGLMYAIQKFDPSKKVRLCAYAKWWIVKAMTDIINAKSTVNDNEESLSQIIQEENDEYADASNNTNEEETVVDFIDEENENINFYKETINMLLSKLDDRSRYIIETYYGLMNKEPLNMVEIGKELGITKERVRQIKDRAMFTLRTHALLEKATIEKATY